MGAGSGSVEAGSVAVAAMGHFDTSTLVAVVAVAQVLPASEYHHSDPAGLLAADSKVEHVVGW